MGGNNLDGLLEQVLILRCQVRDREAIAELIRRYEGRLRYFLGRLTGSREAAEDLFQETWLRVIGKIATLQRPELFAAWMYRIARNLVYQDRRERRPHAELDPEIPDGHAIEDEAVRAEDAAKLHRCLEKLRPEHREVLMLQFLEGMSYEQMAMALGCNPGTVRSRIFYAKQMLKQEMER